MQIDEEILFYCFLKNNFQDQIQQKQSGVLTMKHAKQYINFCCNPIKIMNNRRLFLLLTSKTLYSRNIIEENKQQKKKG